MSDSSLVTQWLQKANNDYISATGLMEKMFPPQIEIACYLCQQSAEKALKAFLVQHDKEIQKTHNLIMLCQACQQCDATFSTLIDDCVYLTPYAVQTRYPNAIELTESEANTAIRKAKKILDFIKQKLDSPPNILDQIVSLRRADIAQFGYTLGASVPEKRTRAKPVPFIAQKGTVLEIKRASPSKGDIAPNLDAAQTATAYAAAGTSAISVLTEQHWFKGGLDDLQAAARAVDEYAAQHGTNRVAILRKDFLLAPEEIDIAYRCGADAVLLIARILTADEMVAMAQKCADLGMTALIELRQETDVQKLAAVVQAVGASHIVCGVNARDLQDFSIDLLTPAGLLATIRAICGNDARTIFESGIRTPQAAQFAGSLGFTGMLLGEAAARNPQEAAALVSSFVHATETPNARAWLDYAAAVRKKSIGENTTRPFVKICGLTNLEDAQKAYTLGADFLGFIFWEKSPRRADEATVRAISAEIRARAQAEQKTAPKLVGVIVDADSADGKTVRTLVREGVLDFVQLHGCADEFFALSDTDAETTTNLPHYAVVNVADKNDLAAIDALRLRGEPRLLIDAKVGVMPGGTGKRIADALVEQVAHKTKLWLAGGITPENARAVCDNFHPELIDVASGVEASPGKKDHAKLEKLFTELGF